MHLKNEEEKVLEKVRVGIIGHTGRLGWPLREIMAKHPSAEIVYTESGGAGAKGIPYRIEAVFLALPHGISGKYIRRFSDKRIIDMSLDHRNNSRWTYGLPEVFGDEARKAEKIANPGCFATSIILGLFPLRGKLERMNISSVSGISGAGMRVAEDDNFLVYREGRKHPQVKEIGRTLKIDDFLFVPQRIDTADRGIVSTIFARTKDSLKNLPELYAEAYVGCPFVRIVGTGTSIETKRVIGTNYCDIKILQSGKDVVIISALDNLMKGGASQAVQNFNLMYGFPETTGLI